MTDPRVSAEAIRAHYRAAVAAPSPADEGWPETAEGWWDQLRQLVEEVQLRPDGIAWRMGYIGDSRVFGLLMSAGVERVRVGRRTFLHAPGAADLEAVRPRFLAAYPAALEARRVQLVVEAQRAADRAAADHLGRRVHHAIGCGEAGEAVHEIPLVTCSACLDRLAGRGLVPHCRRLPAWQTQQAAPRHAAPEFFRRWENVPPELRSRTQYEAEGRRLKVGAQRAGVVRWVPPWGRRRETVDLFHRDDTEPTFELYYGQPDTIEIPADAVDVSDLVAALPPPGRTLRRVRLPYNDD